jgi:hypothetical protein
MLGTAKSVSSELQAETKSTGHRSARPTSTCFGRANLVAVAEAALAAALAASLEEERDEELAETLAASLEAPGALLPKTVAAGVKLETEEHPAVEELTKYAAQLA